MKRMHDQKYQSLKYLIDGHTQGKHLDPQTRFQTYQRNTVKVCTDRGHGSGVLLTHDGYVLTSEHVINNGSKPLFIKIPGTDYSFPVQEVICRSKPYDLAILKVGLSTQAVPTEVVLATTKPRINQRVNVHGYKNGSPEIRTGQTTLGPDFGVSQLMDGLNLDFLKIGLTPKEMLEKKVNANTLYSTCEVSSGWSGGAVVSLDSGELVGITQGHFNDGLIGKLRGRPTQVHGFIYVGAAIKLLEFYLNKEE